MAAVIIALGSNLGDPLSQLKKAKEFLSSISESSILCSPIYASEPVGPSENDFLNAIISIEINKNPEELIELLNAQEKRQGRPSRYPKWTARTLDLDIIAYDDLVLQTDTLIIPHSEYTQRLFVLLPLNDVFPNWKDPKTAHSISELIEKAPTLKISKTQLNW
ncbi:MAG: 2-amino-4-hydroxy-6-hydroxymethyldihydropteridine diphosphokinase [Balneolaceae bacterium]